MEPTTDYSGYKEEMMSKKLLTIGAVVAIIAVAVLALGWFFGPMAGFGPMGYGMHAGFAGGWMNLGWGGALLVGLLRLAFWLIPVVLIAALVAWLIGPRESRSDNQ